MKILHTLIQWGSIGIFISVCYLLPSTISYLILALLFVRVLFFLKPTKGEKIPDYDEARKALFVIDMQEALCGEVGQYPNKQAFVEHINQIIVEAECKNEKIIYIRQEFSKIDLFFCCLVMGGRLLQGTKGANFCSGLKVKGDAVFVKHQQDAFTTPELYKYLKDNEIDTISIVGVDAAACVLKTAYGAVNRGYHVSVIEDGVMSKRETAMAKALKKLSGREIEIHRNYEL